MIFRYRVMCELKMLTVTSDNMTLCIFFTMEQLRISQIQLS